VKPEIPAQLVKLVLTVMAETADFKARLGFNETQEQPVRKVNSVLGENRARLGFKETPEQPA
jgi:hypothetical protein